MYMEKDDATLRKSLSQLHVKLIDVFRDELRFKEGFIHKMAIDKELLTNQLLETLLETKAPASHANLPRVVQSLHN